MSLLLEDAARRAIRYAADVHSRRVSPSPAAVARLAELDRPLPGGPTDPAAVLALLDDVGSPATVATTGGRYFGFVVGGVLPAAFAATWLASAWDQCAGVVALSPAAARIEDVALSWVAEVLGLGADTGGGFVTGATMANFTGLAAARHRLLARAGWDVEAHGLFGAPEVRVVVGDEVHVSLLKALGLLGLGRQRVVRVPVDGQGRMRADALPALDDATILCLQAGNVNTGAFDPARPLVEAARAAGSWVHVDGAFGLWAAASPATARLTDGLADADSWAVDAHKWLNVPYDSGIALCRDAVALRSAMSTSAAYLVQGGGREPDDFTPEMSRRARGVEIWAALASLGRSGLGRSRRANVPPRPAVRRRARGGRLRGSERGGPEPGPRPVRRRRDDPARRGRPAGGRHVLVRRNGLAGPRGHAHRVSSWATTEDDVERSLAAIVRIARETARSSTASPRKEPA